MAPPAPARAERAQLQLRLADERMRMADPEAAQPAGRARARAVPTKKLARMVPGDPWLASTDEPQTMGELKRSFQRRIRADIAAQADKETTAA